MELNFLNPAKIEFVETVKFYNLQCAGLGFDFELAIKDALSRILEYPEAWVKVSRRTRRCQVKRFPYGIIYQIQGDFILVVAVHHLHRDPGSWMNRVKLR